MEVKAPEVEKIEEKQDPVFLAELQKCKANPHKYICDYAESLYPMIGKKTFQVLSLMPCSHILPDLPYGNKTIRSNLNAIFLGSSGSGKSSIAKLFSNFVTNPLEFESITSAGLESAIYQSPVFSLIVGDFARMSRDPTLIKVVEGILGEEKSIKRKTARKEIDLDVNGIALLCGVSSDLGKYILTGMIWRLVPIFVGHNGEEHSKIGGHIINKIGSIDFDDKEEIIKEYYLKLTRNQIGKGDLPRVTSYKIPEQYRKGLYEKWKDMTENRVNELGLNFFRELMDGLRFLISHAFLNSYNREIKDGVLQINQDDYFVAMKLMKQSITFKLRLIKSESFVKGLKDIKDFKKVMQSDKIPDDVKDMIRNLANVKNGKVSKKL